MICQQEYNVSICLISYIRYWSNRFKEHPITDFCTTILMDCTPDGKPSKDESYFLLSDCISEDKALRDEVYKVKLVMFMII